MNNLHRELAPISDEAWAQIEDEASRTLKRHLAARRVVDVPSPKGLELSAVSTGHLYIYREKLNPLLRKLNDLTTTIGVAGEKSKAGTLSKRLEKPRPTRRIAKLFPAKKSRRSLTKPGLF